MIQSGIVLKLGSSGTPNLPGSWAIVIPTVDVTSKWCQWQMSPVDRLPFAAVQDSVNFELGIGDPGLEIRRWQSMFKVGGGSELEFDDSWWVGYLPFNFRKDETVSVRLAAIGATFGMNVDFQLQLYS